MDPFNEVQQDAETQLSNLSEFLNKLSIVTSDNSADFDNSVVELQETLNDLKEAVTISEENPKAFHLTAEDIGSRKRIVSSLESKLSGLKSQYRAKGNGINERKKQRPITSMNNRISQDGNPFLRYDEIEQQNREDNAFPGDNYSHFQQQEVIREQDDQLDAVYVTMQNLNQQARTMGTELEEQGHMLDGLDNDMDRVGTKLNRGMKRVQYVIEKNKEKASDCCIGILVVALVVLLVMVIIL